MVGWMTFIYKYINEHIFKSKQIKHARNLQIPPIVLNLVKILNSTYFTCTVGTHAPAHTHTPVHTCIHFAQPSLLISIYLFTVFRHGLPYRGNDGYTLTAEPMTPFFIKLLYSNWNALLLWCLNLIIYGWFLLELTEMQQYK